MIRKYISISLLVVLLFDAGGFVFGWQVRQWLHKAVTDCLIHSGTFSSELTVIRLSIEHFDSIKIHDHEFRLNNEMFDVVWKETHGSELTLYCFRDADEENLIAEFIGFLAARTSDSKASSTVVVQSVIIGFAFFTPVTNTLFHFEQEGKRFSCNESHQTICHTKRIDMPPPRTFSA